MRSALVVAVTIGGLVVALSAQAQLHASSQLHLVISQRDRDEVYRYFGIEHVAGRCPPGLVEKRDGCLPPGEEKRSWTIGQPLPDDVLYYPLPAVLLGQLTPPPAGYEYARVGNDFLVMGIDSRLVIGALANLTGSD